MLSFSEKSDYNFISIIYYYFLWPPSSPYKDQNFSMKFCFCAPICWYNYNDSYMLHCADQATSENNIPLSPQWLYAKPGDSKVGISTVLVVLTFHFSYIMLIYCLIPFKRLSWLVLSYILPLFNHFLCWTSVCFVHFVSLWDFLSWYNVSLLFSAEFELYDIRSVKCHKIYLVVYFQSLDSFFFVYFCVVKFNVAHIRGC